MSDRSAIEWTESTWNPVRGCTKVSAGCRNCYAETFAERFRGVKGHPYEQGFDLRLVPEALDLPLRWRKPRRVFVNSMSDLFHEDVPDGFLHDVFKAMCSGYRHTFQVLTKRAERMRHFADWWARHYAILPNVWLGVSVEDQAAADERIPELLATPAAVRFISCEPLLGPVNLRGGGVLHDALVRTCCRNPELAPKDGCDGPGCNGTRLDWVIVGGESGPKARPMSLAWARAIVEQCRAASVPVFVKQLGRRPYERAEILGGAGHEDKDLLDVMQRPTLKAQRDGWTRVTTPTGAHLARYWHLAHPKGGDPAEWPEDLRVREWPRGTR